MSYLSRIEAPPPITSSGRRDTLSFESLNSHTIYSLNSLTHVADVSVGCTSRDGTTSLATKDSLAHSYRDRSIGSRSTRRQTKKNNHNNNEQNAEEPADAILGYGIEQERLKKRTRWLMITVVFLIILIILMALSWTKWRPPAEQIEPQVSDKSGRDQQYHDGDDVSGVSGADNPTPSPPPQQQQGSPTNGNDDNPEGAPTLSFPTSPTSTPPPPPSSPPPTMDNPLPMPSLPPATNPAPQPVNPPSSSSMDPVAPPTKVPTSHPTPEPQTLFQFIGQYLEDTNLLLDGTTPQGKAFQQIEMEGMDFGPRVLQRFALMVIFLSTVGDNWLIRFGWSHFTSNECTWYGVDTCRQRDGILAATNLGLDANNLKGTIPAEICLLSNLEEFHFEHNMLQGPLPSCLYQLTKLERFDVGYNMITGNLPSGLATLPNLEAIIAPDNGFSNTLDILFEGGDDKGNYNGFQTLKEIHLENNQLSGSISNQFFFMDELREFTIHGNPLIQDNVDHLCLKELIQFTVDCDNVECSCCTCP